MGWGTNCINIVRHRCDPGVFSTTAIHAYVANLLPRVFVWTHVVAAHGELNLTVTSLRSLIRIPSK